MTKPENSPSIKTMNRQRDYPRNTCPASRAAADHATALMAGDLLDQHRATSIADTVAALWRLRSVAIQAAAYLEATLREEVTDAGDAELLAKRLRASGGEF